MATVNRFRVAGSFLGAGQSVFLRWLNTPRDIVCYIDCTVFAYSTQTQASVELIRMGNNGKGGIASEVGREFFWEFKNTSGTPCIIEMWMTQTN